MESRHARCHHRNIESRTQRSKSRVANCVNAYGAVALILGTDTGLDNGEIHEQCVVSAVTQGGALGDRNEFGMEAGKN